MVRGRHHPGDGGPHFCKKEKKQGCVAVLFITVLFITVLMGFSLFGLRCWSERPDCPFSRCSERMNVRTPPACSNVTRGESVYSATGVPLCPTTCGSCGQQE